MHRSSCALWLACIIARRLGWGDEGTAFRVYHISRESEIACTLVPKLERGGDQAIMARVHHSPRASKLACIIARILGGGGGGGHGVVARENHSSRESVLAE